MNKLNLKNYFTGIYGIISEEHGLGRTAVQQAEIMVQSGIRVIQYREKNKAGRLRHEDCVKIREITRAAGCLFIVNDHADLALASKADGIHIGQDDMPIEAVRGIAGPDIIIGLSTHSPAQALDAVKRGADYIGVGPLFATKTKKDVCEPVGLEYLDFAASRLSIPFVAIGGIKLHNLADVARHGAGCAAMVTEIVAAGDVGERVRAAMDILRQNRSILP